MLYIGLPGYDESVRVERSWSQSPDQPLLVGLDEDDQAVGKGEEVGHPCGVLCVAVLRGDLVVGGNQGTAAVGIAHVGPWVCKEVVVVDREGRTCRAAVEVVKDDQKN